MGGGRLDEFGGGRALALGPLGDAVAGDHPDRTDRLDAMLVHLASAVLAAV
jgi:hypothetical protein